MLVMFTTLTNHRSSGKATAVGFSYEVSSSWQANPSTFNKQNCEETTPSAESSKPTIVH
jgi:hypothetical protein